ncbi:protein kinase domain-containing protein [Psychromonas aquatilis]|uniref:non-specific serine/threonine protein kinase n=1 Tax=Psychromonas aquatilis TaxID=2005072 RepID=A0ABU9GTW1_9GAMM
MDKGQSKKTLKVCLGGYSTAGNREVNQDAFAVKDPYLRSERNNKGIVACVADGVSCSNKGQQASHTSVTQFINDYYSTNNSWDVKQSASKVLSSLNSWLFQHNQEDVRHNGLITTFSSLVLKSTTAHLIHIGDSRIYRYKNNHLEQLSRDHSRTTYNKSTVLTRALGMDSHLDIDYQQTPLEVGDLFMLTSDGVHDYLDHEMLTNYLQGFTLKSTTKEFEEVAQTICDDALAKGSSDNISCLLVQVTALPNADLSELFTHLSKLTIPPALQPGNEIDCFHIDKILHQGTRSHVYLATNKSDQSKVVLKMPSLNFEEDENYLLDFYKEQWVGQLINNPLVMSIAENIKGSAFLYHICEYVEGISLREWIKENPQPDYQDVCDIISKTVSAVRVLQRAGMVHRDLKPENLIISESGDIKLIDFGTVRVNGLEEIAKEQEELPLGAVNYIAPEYLNEGQSSSRSDLFSIAVIAYELLSGELPYAQSSAHTLDKARQYKWEYRPIKQYRTDLPPKLDKILQFALNPKPEFRYNSMSEFVSELISVKKRQGISEPTTSLMERDPVKFWQSLTLIFVMISLAELFLLLSK